MTRNTPDMFDDCCRRIRIERERKELVDRMNKAKDDLKALEAERAEVEARIARRFKGSGDPDACVSLEVDYVDYAFTLGPRDEVQIRRSRPWSWAMFAEKPEEAEADEAPVEEASSSRPLPSDDLLIDDDPCIAERKASVGHPTDLVFLGRS